MTLDSVSPALTDIYADPFFLVIAAVLLGLLFFFFLLIRRTLLSFKQGMDESRRR